MAHVVGGAVIKLTNLSLPISKNALHIPVRCGRFTKLVRSQKARIRGDLIIHQIWQQLGGRLRDPAITKPCSMTWTITFPDRRKRDGQNFYEHLCDLLQAANVVADDSLIVHEVRETMPTFRKPGFVDLTLQELP